MNLSTKLTSSFFVIAHRGASSLAPENTFSAFEKAIECGADMIEFDIQLSADGVPVVFHDVHLDEHTNASGRILDLTLQEIKKLDTGSWYSEEFQNERIPALDEVLKWAKDKILLNIEIKTESVSTNAENGVEEKVIKLVQKYKMEKQVLISSFDYRALKRINLMETDIKLGVLYNKQISEKISPVELVQNLQVEAFHCGKDEISNDWIDSLKSQNIPILVYTVNDETRMQELIEKRVTGIFSDNPDLLRKAAKIYQ